MGVFVRLIALLLLTAYCFGIGTQIPESQLNDFGRFCSLAFFVLAPTLYFFPTIEAAFKGHKNMPAIAMLNLLLGWSVIGWVVALVWTAKEPYKEKHLEGAVLTNAVEPEYVVYIPPRVLGEDDTRPCPMCAETIKRAAVKCKHCGSDVFEHGHV